MLPYLKKNTILKTKKKFVPVGANFPAFDATLVPNTVARYDGDVGLTNLAWVDVSGFGRNLTFFNLPTINLAALNGHDTVTFDGINQYGETVAYARNQPSTFYIVSRMIVTGNGLRIIDGFTDAYEALFNALNNNTFSIYAGNHLITGVLIQTNWNLYTGVFNGANSVIRVNNAAGISGDSGLFNASGLRMASKGGVIGEYANVEIAYLILRTGADPVWLQTNIINWLKTRFAL